MANEAEVLAVDLGASHGRVIKGSFDGNRLIMNTVHEFENKPVVLGNKILWDHIALAENTLLGIWKAGPVSSVGVDTWGHDFIPVTPSGNLLGSMYCYRDERTSRIASSLSARLDVEDTYLRTGVSTNTISTLFQLAALKDEEPEIYEAAGGFLFVADYINYILCGARYCNETQVSMGGMYDIRSGKWCGNLLKRLQLKENWGEITRCTEVVGKTKQGIKVVAVAAHDTASALSFIPNYSDKHILLSNGTWALVGIKSKKPVISEEAMKSNLQIELGSFGDFLQINNLTGMWLMQELAREWNGIHYEQLNIEAGQSHYAEIIDTQHPTLFLPGNMAEKISALLRENGRPVPSSKSEFYRCILLSLCKKFKDTIADLERIYNCQYDAINIVGGGARNDFFNRLIAEQTGKKVYAGPFEATAAGNLITQLISMGEISGPEEAAQVIERSFDLKEHLPKTA